MADQLPATWKMAGSVERGTQPFWQECLSLLSKTEWYQLSLWPWILSQAHITLAGFSWSNVHNLLSSFHLLGRFIWQLPRAVDFFSHSLSSSVTYQGRFLNHLFPQEMRPSFPRSSHVCIFWGLQCWCFAYWNSWLPWKLEKGSESTSRPKQGLD